MACKWPAIPLLDLYEVTNGLSKGKEDFGHGFPFLTFKEVFNSYFVPDTLINLANTSPQEQKKCSIKEGDVFITRTSETFNELGMSCVALKNYENATFNGFCKRLRPKSGTSIYAKYAAFYFGSDLFRDQITALANMSTRASLNNDMLKHLVVHLPDIEAQRNIGDFLYKVTMFCSNNEKTNQILEEIAQAIFKSWFVDFDPVKAKAQIIAQGGSEQDANLAAMEVISGKTRDQLAALEKNHPEHYTQLHTTATHFPSAFEESELGEIPEGWSTSPLGPLLNRLKVQNRYTKNDITSKGSVKILDQGSLRLLGFHDASPEINATEKDPTFIFGDHTCIFKLSLEPFNVAANVIPLTGNNCDTYWLFYASSRLQSFQEYRRHWMELISKVTAVPTIKLQQEYRNRICSLHRMIESNDKQSMALSELRDEILPKLLSGEIDVSQLNLEV